MAKSPQTDLLPWILGALLVTAAIPAVIAVTGISTTSLSSSRDGPVAPRGAPPAGVTAGPTAPTQSQPLSPGGPDGSHGASATTNPGPGSPSGSPDSSSAQDGALTDHSPPRPALPAGAVWQCESNGQPTFSDAPCGPGATLRQLHEVNGMDAPPTGMDPQYSSYAGQPMSGPNQPSPPPGYYAPPADGYPGGATSDTADGEEAGATAVTGGSPIGLIDGHPNHRHMPNPRPPHRDHRTPAPSAH